MANSFARLPKPSLRKIKAAAPRTVCIVTGELAGPDFNGGIGTANLGLALELTTAGHAVQILYTRVASGVPHPSAAVFTQNVDQLALSGLTLQALDFTGPWHDWLGKSHAVLSWLSDQQFDAVFFNDTHGAGFASLLAKKTGLRSLRATNMIVVAHSATQWIFDINQQPVANMAALEQIELERRSLELADTVISPSAYLLETYHSYGWALPEESFVHPNILPFSTLPASRQTPLNGPPEELVFFGRLETRKGLWLFCNALDRLKNRLIDTRVTFLGKSVPEDGEPSVLALLERAKSWPFEIRLLTDYDSPTALAYLARQNCVAVMPSFAENSPCAVAECLELQIPFIATSGSGTEELLAKSNRDRSLVEPTITALVAKIEGVLTSGLKPAKPSGNARRNADHLIAWTATLPTGSAPEEADASPAPCQVYWLVDDEDGPAADGVGRALDSLPDGSEISVIPKSGGTIGTHKDRLVVIADPSMVITADDLQRAEACFAATPDVVAVAGLCEGQEPVLGPSQAMMPVVRNSNQGFAFFRPAAQAVLATEPLVDRTNDRLFPATVWLHRVFATLMAKGQRCELLPDFRIRQKAAGSSRPFEGFDPLLDRAPAHHPMAAVIDLAHARAHRTSRRQAALDCFAGRPAVAEHVAAMNGVSGSPDARAAMAQLAGRLGRPEIAYDLASPLISTTGDGENPAQNLQQAAYQISLFDLASADWIVRHNLDQTWSYKLIANEREIEVHANHPHEGRAMLCFDGLDLSRSTALQTTVRLPHRLSKPALCRIEIINGDKTSRVTQELTLEPGSSQKVCLALPRTLSSGCLISFSVATAFETDSPTHCWVRLVDPILVPETLS